MKQHKNQLPPFQQQLQAIKKFVLLEQGNFAQNLLEKIMPILNKPAHLVLKSELLDCLDEALQQSALFGSETVRLYVVFLEPQGQLTNGWDIFSLDYTLDSRFSFVDMESYHLIGNFLWKLKKAEHACNQYWRNNVIPKRSKELQECMRKETTLVRAMQNFLRQSLDYFYREVIEPEWYIFINIFDENKPQEQIVQLHKEFQSNLFKRFFLAEKQKLINQVYLRIFQFVEKYTSNNHEQDEVEKVFHRFHQLVQELRMSLRTHFYDVSYLRVTESEPLRWNQLSDEEGQDEDLSEEDCLYE